MCFTLTYISTVYTNASKLRYHILLLACNSSTLCTMLYNNWLNIIKCFIPIKNKINYSLSESVTVVPSHANWIQRRVTVALSSELKAQSKILQIFMNGLGWVGSFVQLLPQWLNKTSCLTTAFCKNFSFCLVFVSILYLVSLFTCLGA